jgi:hypothetical protein
MKKRGLSQVVTTVLIILIVLAAIVLIWAAVRPTIQSASEQISADCITVELEAVSCSGDVLDVKRSSGAGDLTGVIFVFSDGSTDTNNTVAAMPGPLETVSITSPNGVISGLTNIAAIVGQGNVCEVSSSAPVTC